MFVISCQFIEKYYVGVIANGGDNFSKGDLIMRKVLLATTALVAITGVTAANADISISGNYEWEYTSYDTGSTFGSDSHITIKAVNAADNGMTFTAVTVLGNGDLDSNHIKVDGDFGTVYLGDVDGNSAASLMDGALGRNKDIEGQGGLGSEATHNGTADTAVFLDGGADIIYMTPSIGGLKLGIGADLTDSDASVTDGAVDMAVSYSMSGINLYAGGTSGQEFDESNFGLSTSLAGLTIGVGSRSEGGTSKAKSNDVGLQYTLANGIKIAGLSASGTGRNGTTKVKASNLGASYPVVPGVKLNAESGVLTVAGVDSNYTWVAVNMSF